MGLIEEYCGSSTVHGVKYFTEKRRHWVERVWWILAFTLALFYCGYTIRKVYIKWDESPVIVAFAEKSTPCYNLRLPAVTICPETKAEVTKLNLTDVFNRTRYNPYNITAKEAKLMAAVVHICEPYLSRRFTNVSDFKNSSITDLLRDVAPSSQDTIHGCYLGKTDNECFFEEFMTEDGLCFTFNALNGSELFTDDPDYMRINHNMSAGFWNLEDGYDSSIEAYSSTYPYRVFGSGTQEGIYVRLNQFIKNLEIRCRGAVQGFKISLHTPGEVPQVSKHFFRVPLLQEALVAVKPIMITTSEGLRDYEPNRRQCFFASERKLRFLKVYTQRNCQLECLANFTLTVCGCVKFSMPRDKDTSICGITKIDCYNEAENNLSRKQFEEESTLETGAKGLRGCNCLPACTSFITSKRSELYGKTDFLANCGGLLGLFMGASFLSIFELLYFFSLRLCCNLRSRMHRKRKNTIADSAVPEIVVVNPNDDDKKE
ncbi:hypothetical protein HA402_005693 [Bradysia odoriphaga]|nr:hypothetical protein HA402_005693 [Bradysia odoriphaga]